MFDQIIDNVAGARCLSVGAEDGVGCIRNP